MDLGSQDNQDMILKLLQYLMYVVAGLFAYFGRKAMNDISKLKQDKADITYVDKENLKQEKEFENRLREADKINKIILEDLKYIRERVDNIYTK